MKALRYHDANHARGGEVANPILVGEDGIILRVPATATCGSDLLSHAVPSVEPGEILADEFRGVVEETGWRRGVRMPVTGWLSFTIPVDSAHA